MRKLRAATERWLVRGGLAMTLVIATVAGTPVVAQLSAGSISRGQFHSGLAKDAHATDARLHRAAAELYQATSRDAETFEAALLIPEIRLRLEQALHQKLSDQMLRRLASQAKAEARYWYSYMQGLERVGDVSPAAR